eukprot:TRINITY_DN9011_c0_g1_i1.p1 TRINITY_DN9011_c0_g1~~TRINITY_DN9011_c0_g1_i1.p1  ORF type:complete len:645 (-),score=169.47 TRINITY_DN9011_c0_g1_i1:118-2052(-)
MSRVDKKGRAEELLKCSGCKAMKNPLSVLSSHQVQPGPGDSAYQFMCSDCNDDGKATFKHTQKTWSEIAITALHNLERSNRKKSFTLNEITNYIEQNSDVLLSGKQKTSSLTSSLQKALSSSEDSPFDQSSTDPITYSLQRTSPPSSPPPKRSKKDSTPTDSRKKSKADTPKKSGDSDHKKKHKKDSDNSPEPRKKSPEPRRKSGKVDDPSPEKSGYMWCHQCKQKHGEVIYCSRTCSKKYCTRCVKRHYREKVDEIDQSQWICYYCQGVCSCAFCRRRRAKETNTKFESHRGKKRRIVADVLSEELGGKKRKKNNNDDDDKPKSNKYDDWIVDDEEENSQSTRITRSESKQRKSRNSTQSKPPQSPITRSNRRINLKDLIDAQILSPGEEIIFRNSDIPAVLLADGTIRWSGSIFNSLSTFAKKVSLTLDNGKSGKLFNGWRVVTCRGKIMDQYRKQYLGKEDSEGDGSDDEEEDVGKKEEEAEDNGEEIDLWDDFDCNEEKGEERAEDKGSGRNMYCDSTNDSGVDSGCEIGDDHTDPSQTSPSKRTEDEHESSTDEEWITEPNFTDDLLVLNVLPKNHKDFDPLYQHNQPENDDTTDFYNFDNKASNFFMLTTAPSTHPLEDSIGYAEGPTEEFYGEIEYY